MKKSFSYEVIEERTIITRVFVLTNHKEGVGKSISATNIALGITGLLRQIGAQNPRVLLIDTDSQLHATLITTGRDDFDTEKLPKFQKA